MDGNALSCGQALAQMASEVRKSTPFAAETLLRLQQNVWAYGLKIVKYTVKVPGSDETTIICLGHWAIATMIRDITPVPHNGHMSHTKKRRV